MWYYGNSLSEIKQAMYLRVGYRVQEWWDIHIYYKTNEKDWTELTEQSPLTANRDMRSPFATSLKLNCRFQWIQFRFVLSGWDTHVYSADLYYNDMLD